MEIRRPHFSASVTRPIAALSRRVALIAVIIGIVMSSWTAWTIWTLWNDLPLPPDRVTAKQLRVSESLREQLTQDLASMRSSTATSAVPNIPFSTSQ